MTICVYIFLLDKGHEVENLQKESLFLLHYHFPMEDSSESIESWMVYLPTPVMTVENITIFHIYWRLIPFPTVMTFEDQNRVLTSENIINQRMLFQASVHLVNGNFYLNFNRDG